MNTDFISTTAGQILALRLAVSAIFATHDKPEDLLSNLQKVLQQPGSLDGQLPPAIQVAADKVIEDLTGLLVKKINS